MARRVLVGFDGSEPSHRALDFAIERAKPTGDEVVVMTVIPPSVAGSSLADMMPAGVELPSSMSKTFEENARARLDDLVREKHDSGVKLRAEVRTGEPLHAFMLAVKEFGASEIVIGHKSYERENLRLGPIAEGLVKHMPAIVTVVR